MTDWRLSWPRAWGEPVGEGRIRTLPEDFFVDEQLGWPLSGEGEHLCLRLEKTGDNTDYVAGEIARLAGCRRMDVSFCGLKDRNAVTRQWFSIYRPKGDDAPLIDAVGERWQVLESGRHNRKLRRGDHGSNLFRLRLRECTAVPEALEEAFGRIMTQGCPNYFGSQRFGFDGGNLERALSLRPRDLRGRAGFKSGMYLSAARSWLFNEWLAQRIAAGDWQEVLPGDPGAEATGPLAGDGDTLAGEPLLAREMQFLAPFESFMALFRQARLKPARRAMVLRPLECALEWQGADPVLQFALPSGSYATAVLQELIDVVDERVRADPSPSPGENL